MMIMTNYRWEQTIYIYTYLPSCPYFLILVTMNTKMCICIEGSKSLDNFLVYTLYCISIYMSYRTADGDRVPSRPDSAASQVEAPLRDRQYGE